MSGISNPLHRVLPYVLKPMSWLYGMVTDVRNWLFDHGVLPVEEFDVPVVSIGNLTVGGTGKTPHVEYLAGVLSSTYNIAVLACYKERRAVLSLPTATVLPRVWAMSLCRYISNSDQE